MDRQKVIILSVSLVSILVIAGTAGAVFYYRAPKTASRPSAVISRSPTSSVSIAPVTTPSIVIAQSASLPKPSVKAVAETGSCSPRGTATCDGEGRPLTPGGNSGIIAQGGGAGLAEKVTKLTDIGLRTVALSSGGTNGLDIDPDSGLVYAVSNSTVGSWCNKPIGKRADLLSVIDPVQGKETAAVSTEKGPVWPLVDTGNDRVYVATSADGLVVWHKRGSGEKLETLPVGGLPHDLGLDSQSGVMLVSNTNDGSEQYVAAVDVKTKKVLGQHKTSSLPHRIALDSTKRLAYVMSVESGMISVFNTTAGQPAGQFETGGRGTMAFSALKRLIFVPAAGEAGQAESIQVVNADSHEKVGKIGPFLTNAGHQAFGLAVDDTNRLLFVAIGDSGLVGVADLDSLQPLAVFEANSCVWGIKLDTKRQLGYVTDAASGAVSIFDLRKIANSLKR